MVLTMWRLTFVVFLVWPLEASAVELRPINVVTGTEGLMHVPVDVHNTGKEPFACTLQLAHWYSMALGATEPGTSTRIDLWFDKATATYLVLNGKQENMPVEAAWCGLSNRAYETRTEIRLDRHLGSNPVAREVRCAGSGDHLVCE